MYLNAVKTLWVGNPVARDSRGEMERAPLHHQRIAEIRPGQQISNALLDQLGDSRERMLADGLLAARVDDDTAAAIARNS